VPRPLRLAFVGQRTYFAPCSLEDAVAGVEPAFFDLRSDERAHELAAALADFGPDVVIAFRPELVPAGALHHLDAVTVGWLTEPLPRLGQQAHPDLELRLEYLRRLDVSNFDRVLAFDPLIAPAASPIFPVWRSLPLPVSDRLFAPVRDTSGPPRLLFVGRSTPHRESFLGPLKHDFDLLHVAHGVTEARLAAAMAEADIAINLHNQPYPTFENRVATSLAGGLLVLSEPLSPRHGLLAAVDHLVADDPWRMWQYVRQAAALPGAFRSIRVHGRRQAERFRASRVYPSLARDALADVAVFGQRRASYPSGSRLAAAPAQAVDRSLPNTRRSARRSLTSRGYTREAR